MNPNSKNFCGGAFPDWLEVNLTDKCNGKCSWCIEKTGYHPKIKASWEVIADAAISHGALNIILLGGEPTLYKNIKPLVAKLITANRQVWMTTNGSLLTPAFVKENLIGLLGINISIHHYNLGNNKEITGLKIDYHNLTKSVDLLHEHKTSVRLNCNCINGHIDSVDKIVHYIAFAKIVGADKVRFAELKQDNNGFVDLAKILNYKYGTNDNPFILGCNSDAVINGMPINFRQMCGLQTTRREKPHNPRGIMKKVLYYDGKLYNGWQTQEVMKMTTKMTNEKKVTKKELLEKIKSLEKKVKDLEKKSHSESGGFCQY
jgi:organic radical activating enzyme